MNFIPRYFLLIILLFSFSTKAVAETYSWFGAPPKNVVGLGMWTVHLRPSSGYYVYNNKGLAIVYRSIFLSAFKNCFGDRSYAVGFQRDWYRRQLSTNWDWTAGYRLGVMTGYDERLMHLAKKSPVVPLIQLLTAVNYKKVGFELGFTGVTISGIVLIQF